MSTSAKQSPNDQTQPNSPAASNQAAATPDQANSGTTEQSIEQSDAFKQAVKDEVAKQLEAQKTATSNRPTLPQPESTDFFLKKDTEKKFPLSDKKQLEGVIVRQTRKIKVQGHDTVVPAHDLSELGIYSEEEYNRMSAKGGVFERQGIDVEVWHKPGDEGTVAE